MHDLAHDHELDVRLAALETRAPAGGEPPDVTARGGRRGATLPLTIAPILALGIAATAAAGAVVVGQVVTGREGMQNPGQPLEGARLECMTPPQAAAYLADRGYTEVVWQVETDGPAGRGGGTTTTQQATAPEHGLVVPGSILDDGRPIVIVDQRAGASGVGDCVGRSNP